MDKYMALLFVIIPALYFAYTLYKKRKKGWHIMWSAGVPKQPTKQGSGWYVDIPTPPGHLNYIQNFNRKSLKGKQRMTAYFTVAAGEVIAPEYNNDATTTLIIQRKGDNGSGAGKYEAYRWYSREMIKLVEGEYVLSVDLTHDKWTSINGRGDAAAFADALENAESIGLVFGSAGGRGHGVHATQPTRFTLTRLEVL